MSKKFQGLPKTKNGKDEIVAMARTVDFSKLFYSSDEKVAGCYGSNH